MLALTKIVLQLATDVFRLAFLLCRSTRSIQAENLFLRRQLALFRERGVQPRRVDAAARISLAVLARFFDWRNALLLIRRMARENPVWGEERIASELLVKLGIRVSPRTVRKYMPKRPQGQPRGDTSAGRHF